jgi:hypothetical protein
MRYWQGMPSRIRENHQLVCVGRGNVSSGIRHGDRYRLLFLTSIKLAATQAEKKLSKPFVTSTSIRDGGVASYEIVGCSSDRKACASQQLRNSRMLFSSVDPAGRPRDSHTDVACDQMWLAGQRT